MINAVSLAEEFRSHQATAHFLAVNVPCPLVSVRPIVSFDRC
ncbi:hypothetical protein HMPREF1249_0880 [Jonquetella sp. BV3C21]|nr:hypothetical protein HMPREF1249_0880 [Jonquetella sp. BV3C21]